MPEFAQLHPTTVLGVVAHPDDLDFGASGTMAHFANQGADVYYLILTDGSKGSEDKTMTPAQLTALRRNEQRTALQILGGKQAVFLNYCDGELAVSMELKRDIVKHIRQLQPDVVVTMDPAMLYSAERGFINHPDHRAAGQATLDAVYPLARDHLSFPELCERGFEPHKTATMLLMNFDSANFWVDITKTFDRKLQALAAHASQIPDIDGVSQMMRNVAETAGKSGGYQLAESFMRIDIR